MNGKEILVDTNILIYLLDGDDTISYILKDKHLCISFITELELIGFKNITVKQEKHIQQLLSECNVLQMSDVIKKSYVSLRKKYNLKLADSIIVATAISSKLPLMSVDKQLKTIKELDLLIYNK